MNGENQHIDGQEEVSKVLKELPRVNASPDFEARLQRKITEPFRKPERKRLFDFLFFPQRVPVFATSILALMAVSVISYYIFVKSGGEPQVQMSKQEVEQIPAQSEINQENKSLSPTEISSTISEQKAEPQRTEKHQTQKSSKPVLHEETSVADKATVESKENEVSVQEQDAVAGEANLEQAVQVPKETQMQQEAQKMETKSLQQIGETRREMIQPMQQFQSVPRASEKMMMQEFSVSSPKMKKSIFSDSSRIADSLRQDSLKKAQFKLLQQKQKIKPN
ncbi:MAG: hypothetical protein HYZ33_00680 [Ignavibacteriales bacterium]|nr:hypothetical protein [Ignavibacteriales bacterium]